jgi:AcrR family transcriptional regulator
MMTTGSIPGTREIGRPRSFSDEAIFHATARVLAGVGNEHLTLALIAEEVGCSPPALVQRFGSKRALLRSYMEWSIDKIRARFETSRAQDGSPLETLKAQVRLPRSERPDQITDPEGYPSTVFIHLAAWNDESFRPQVEARTQLIEDEIARLLELATEAGEIAGGDPRNLAKTMLTAFTGAALQSIAMPTERIEDRLAELVDILIEPYRTGANA